MRNTDLSVYGGLVSFIIVLLGVLMGTGAVIWCIWLTAISPAAALFLSGVVLVGLGALLLCCFMG